MTTTNQARFQALTDGLAKITPAVHDVQDSPYTISNAQYDVLRHVLHDVGGQPALPVEYLEKEEEAWEMNTYVTCECLAWRGSWNAEMRRRAEVDLGETQYFGLPYYARWVTVAARVMVDKGLIPLSELTAKIDEVRSRLQEERK
ncbi:SH3-like domain-containing protein [Rhodococcus sp. SGAir0479]|uniref:SH3-like domain-containing protein n=1 Tax=Rhodococcus sp. SGAir0479 TaxID=2567884 RepID=UPI0010CD6450|nr:nitrile hydratase subunit beta [Rhodococcus sp. SGAir0479]